MVRRVTTRPEPVPRARPSRDGGATALRAMIVVAILLPPLRLLFAWLGEHVLSFPIDDPWIHLAYARTLVETGRWSYFPGAPLSAGSTSPLFVLLEAALFRIVPNEKLLAIGLGCVAHAAFVLLLGRWFVRRTGSVGWAAVAVLLVATNSQVSLLAISGMETSLFLLAVALAFSAWAEDDGLGSAVAVGLATWVRPEGLLLGAVLAIDALIVRRLPRRSLAGAVAASVLLGGYAAFNHALGGHWLPNTIGAKAALLRDRPLGEFLRNDLLWVFGHAELLLLPFAAFAAWRSLRGGSRESRVAAEAGWALALPLACALGMHSAHVFGRYLVPALPAWILCGVQGLQRLEAGEGGARRAPRALAIQALIAIAVVWQTMGLAQHEGEYASYVRYYSDRHERTGRWLAANTPPTAVIATHDVGAIGFYSRRRIVDLAGLVDAEIVSHLAKPDFTRYLDTLLPARRVTHVAVLENVLSVDNEKPLFEATSEPELLHVYAYRPGVTHFIPAAAQKLNDAAAGRMMAGHAAEAEVGLRRSLALDDEASTTWTLLATVLLSRGDLPGAEAAYRNALARYPAQPEARTGLAEALRRAGRGEEARAVADSIATLDDAAR